MRRTVGTAFALLWLLGGSTVAAQVRESSGDASITQDSGAGTWTMSAGGSALTLTAASGRDFEILRLTGPAARSWTGGAPGYRSSRSTARRSPSAGDRRVSTSSPRARRRWTAASSWTWSTSFEPRASGSLATTPWRPARPCSRPGPLSARRGWAERPWPISMRSGLWSRLAPCGGSQDCTRCRTTQARTPPLPFMSSQSRSTPVSRSDPRPGHPSRPSRGSWWTVRRSHSSGPCCGRAPGRSARTARRAGCR